MRPGSRVAKSGEGKSRAAMTRETFDEVTKRKNAEQPSWRETLKHR